MRLNRQQTLVVLALAAGLSRAGAAAKAGIADRTLRRWVAADAEFAEAVEVAVGTGRAMYEELILKHASTDWRAAFQLYESIYLGAAKRLPQASFEDVAGKSETAVEDEMAAPDRLAAVVDVFRRTMPDDRIADLLARRAGA